MLSIGEHGRQVAHRTATDVHPVKDSVATSQEFSGLAHSLGLSNNNFKQ